jgi:hypothetical protein
MAHLAAKIHEVHKGYGGTLGRRFLGDGVSQGHPTTLYAGACGVCAMIQEV